MDRIAVAGLTIHETTATELERVARSVGVETARRELADRLAASELVVLRTCNRVEIVLARESGSPPSPRERHLVAEALGMASPESPEAHFHCGRAAVRHLFRVACSLDSLVVGEDQILTQVREAWTAARDEGLTGPLLDPVFEAAIQVGKRVRTGTELCRHPVSVVALGVQALIEALPEPRARRPATIALVGAGRTARLAGQTLRAAGLEVTCVVHRTSEGAATLAAELGARPLSLEAFRAGTFPVDALVSATSSPEPVLDGAALLRIARPSTSGPSLVAIDLALPRDLVPPPLDPARDSDRPRVRVVDLETLRALAERNRERRASAIGPAEACIEEKLEVLERRQAQRRTEHLWSEVLAEAGERLEHELRALHDGRLARLEPREREAVERWARSTFGRLAHVPLQAVKRLAAERGDWLEGTEEETTG